VEAFRQFIENYTTVSDKDWKQISACFDKRVIEKGEMLLQEGKVCKHLYFIESGLLRYFIYKNGNDITKYFTEAPYCFTSQVSFTTEKPATENIQAIEQSIIWEITLKQANNLLEELKSWNTFIRKLIQEVQYYTEEILQEIQTETAENRYLKMLEQEPQLVQRIPLKHLASYFGIAPQSLSRIRKKITAKKTNLT
jgi:CRP-like cAMP-binding protein